MDEEMGIYRIEVLTMMGAIADIHVDVKKILATLREKTMKRKKRKIFRTPEERAAWQARYEATMRRLEWHYDRIRAELEAKGPIEGPPLPDFPDWQRAG